MGAAASEMGYDVMVRHICEPYWFRGTCNRCVECQQSTPEWAQSLSDGGIVPA